MEYNNQVEEILLSMQNQHKNKNDTLSDSAEPYYKQNSVIFSECYYGNRLTALLNNKTISSENFEVPDWEEISDDFSFALDKLCNSWIKFRNSPYLSENDYSLELFQIIYEAYPQLCIEIFPVALFVFADSYFDFCNMCYIDPKHQTMPEKFSYEQKSKILSLFSHKIEGNDYQYYLFSLIDVKNNYYSESAFSQGERIFNQLLSQCKENIETLNDSMYDDYDFLKNRPKIIEQMESLIKTKYDHAFNKKKKKSSIEALLGENFQALWKFIHDFSLDRTTDNFWEEYDTAFTLYALNNMTCWLNCLVFSANTINEILYLYYTQPAFAILYYLSHFSNNTDEKESPITTSYSENIIECYEIAFQVYYKLQNDHSVFDMITSNSAMLNERMYTASECYEGTLNLPNSLAMDKIKTLLAEYILSEIKP